VQTDLVEGDVRQELQSVRGDERQLVGPRRQTGVRLLPTDSAVAANLQQASIVHAQLRVRVDCQCGRGVLVADAHVEVERQFGARFEGRDWRYQSHLVAELAND